MKKKLLGFALSVMAATAAHTSHAAPVTIEFTASGFQNAGVQYPGTVGTVSGRITWEQAAAGDPIGALTDIDLTIGGHSYTLQEVGVVSNSATQSTIGAAPSGFNAVVGNGAAHDFMMGFDRVNPQISFFALAIEGQTGAIWWMPTFTEARFVSHGVPEPAAWLLAACGIGALTVSRRPSRRQRHA